MVKRNLEVSVASKLKIESRGMFVTSAFYAAVGVIFFVLLVMAGFPPYLGIIGIFSLITAYGIFRKRAWTIWLVMILFFVGTTFSAVMIYYVPEIDYVLSIGVVIYLILTWIFTAYVVVKRKSFES
jgi:SNF family Na+-dependent transporter